MILSFLLFLLILHMESWLKFTPRRSSRRTTVDEGDERNVSRGSSSYSPFNAGSWEAVRATTTWRIWPPRRTAPLLIGRPGGWSSSRVPQYWVSDSNVVHESADRGERSAEGGDKILWFTKKARRSLVFPSELHLLNPILHTWFTNSCFTFLKGMQKTVFFTKIIFCSITFKVSESLSNHTVCKSCWLFLVGVMIGHLLLSAIYHYSTTGWHFGDV